MHQIDKAAVKEYLLGLQDSICTALGAVDSSLWQEDSWIRDEGEVVAVEYLSMVRLLRKVGLTFPMYSAPRCPLPRLKTVRN